MSDTTTASSARQPIPSGRVLKSILGAVALSVVFNLIFGSFVKKAEDVAQGFIFDTVLQTAPLTVAAAAISVLVGISLLDRTINFWVVPILALLIFDIAGFVGTLTTGALDQFMNSYGAYIPSSDVRVKFGMYAILSVIGFYDVYGPMRFFSSLAIGAVAPWAALVGLTSAYQTQEKQLAEQDAADR